MLDIMLHVKFSDQDIETFMRLGINGVMQNWAATFDVRMHGSNEVFKPTRAARLAETLNKGGTITIAEDEIGSGDSKDFVWHTIDLETIRKGIELFFRYDSTGANHDVNTWSAEIVDKIFQYAIFGRIAYEG